MVSNLNQTIEELQRAGVWVVGLEQDDQAQDIDAVDLDLPLALVIGAEGTGIARLVRERCDFLVRLPIIGQVGSLNAAIAGSIAIYYAWRQRHRPVAD
jgi:23S rRNA (guanosine2251-2'-O)-methyltransferase